MGGWKTKTGAILVGLSKLVPMVVPLGGLSDPISNAIAAIGAAFAAWGIGHKIEKGPQQ